MKLNKIGKVWNGANSFLSDFFGLSSSKNFATMATWRNEFSLQALFKILRKQIFYAYVKSWRYSKE